jgi:excisionase family DNA binding protein
VSSPALAKRYATLAQAAEYLSCNERTLRRQIAAGKLPAYRLGKLIRIDLADLDALIKPVPTVDGAA